MVAWRTLGVLASVLAFTPASWGQSYTLTETPKNGECFRYSLTTSVSGMLKIPQDGKTLPIKLAVEARHTFDQRTLMLKEDSIIKTARMYATAETATTVGGETAQHRLRDDRRLIVAQQSDDGVLCYSPGGPLTREEQELCTQHLDTLHLTGILPNKGVDLNEKWKLSNATAQSLCQFEGLIEHDLQGWITEVKDGAALVRIEGKASGIELGAMVKLEITGTLRYELLPKRIVSIEWTRKDKRDSGPANPPSEIDTTTKLTRSLLDAEPKELSDVSLVSVPPNLEIPGPLAQLTIKDGKGRYQMLHSRDWHTVSKSDNYLVMRLLDRGDFVAQATVASWRKAEPGKHLSAEEFEQIVSQQPNWEMEELVDKGEIPTDGGRWLYRITARGNMNGLKVIQTFYCLANSDGEQLMITFVMKPTNSTKIGTRDVALVNSIEFIKK